VPVPVIDQIETCSLPNPGVDRLTLRTMRKALMERQVAVWGADLKKQKREIRMLH
jgi:hypothetical protein